MDKIRKAILVEILAGLFLTLVVVFFWQRPLGAVLLLMAGIGFWLWRYRNRVDAAAMLAAAFLGTPSEMLCVKFGVWQYHYPYFSTIGMPISLPMAWGLSAVIIGRIAKTWDSALLASGNLEDRYSLFYTACHNYVPKIG